MTHDFSVGFDPSHNSIILDADDLHLTFGTKDDLWISSNTQQNTICLKNACSKLIIKDFHLEPNSDFIFANDDQDMIFEKGEVKLRKDFSHRINNEEKSE